MLEFVRKYRETEYLISNNKIISYCYLINLYSDKRN